MQSTLSPLRNRNSFAVACTTTSSPRTSFGTKLSTALTQPREIEPQCTNAVFGETACDSDRSETVFAAGKAVCE